MAQGGPPIQLLLLLLATLMAAPSLYFRPAEACSTTSVTAALRNHQRVIFFYGTIYISYDLVTQRRGQPREVSKLFKNYPKMSIDAAYRQPKKPHHLVLISGNRYYTAHGGRIQKGPLKLRNLFPKNTEFAGGVEAVATHGKRIFYFKGCTVLRKAKSGARHRSSLKRMGIPCNIDAAWEFNKMIILSKGPFTWRMDPNTMIARLYCFYCNPAVLTDTI